MSERREIVGTVAVGGTVLMVLLAMLGGLAGCNTVSGHDIRPAGDSFFPMSVGNEWVFASYSGGREISRDTVRIVEVTYDGGWRYYRLQARWPGFGDGLWVRRDQRGNLVWASEPGGNGYTLLRFDENIGARWETGPGPQECVDSLAMYDNYAAVRTPYGLFDGARSFGCVPSCSDFGWGVTAARGIGPVQWTEVTISGGREWLLVTADFGDDMGSPEAPPRIVDGF